MPSRRLLSNLKYWIPLPAYVLLFSLLVFPMVPGLLLLYARFFLLGVTLAIVGVVMVKTGRTGLHPAVAVWTLALSALSFLFVLEGFFGGAPGAGKTITIYIVYPLVYAFMMAGVRNERVLSGLNDTLVVSTICIGVYSIVYILINTNILPENRYFDLISFDWQAQAFGLHEGYIAMQFPGINSFTFLVPFSLAAAVTCLPRIVGLSLLRRVGLWTAAFLSLVSVLISGRRALYLVTLIAPFLTLLFISFQPMAERRWSKRTLVRVTASGTLAVVISLVSLNAFYGIRLTGIVDRLSVGFDFNPTSEDDGTIERREQYHALLAGWMENPLLGAGHGAPAFGSIRSQPEPWSYELCYMALLYQTGLLGVAAYAAGICWIYWMGVRVIRSGGYLSALMVACLVGMSSSLIANATNPYLDRFDGMWAIFLPLALINFWFLRHPAPRCFSSQRFASA